MRSFAVVVVIAPGPAQAQKRIVGYVPNWVDLDAFSKTIDYGKLTHINIAFENPVNDEGDLSFESKNKVIIDAAQKNGVKVLISIGGGAAATDPILKARYFNLLTNAKRRAFVAKLAKYVTDHGFDGLDVDIDGPSINANYGAFVANLARALKPSGKLLTSALSKGYGGDRVPDEVFEHYDFINIMAYDETGPWSPNSPGQHSSHDYAVENIRYWLARGLPKSKAVLGVRFMATDSVGLRGRAAIPIRKFSPPTRGRENGSGGGGTRFGTTGFLRPRRRRDMLAMKDREG